ncbi:SRPBCC family protein [Cryobacterium luteum]|uniref:SRPBCC family protein n=1 Tax=Cryobacterium luteum TaxID=1424661 RepID=A0A1H8LSI3_9MICO|nr:SRPBCC family protein [Cryobacterium luteum]TFB82409.1 SRPBCC family protein [Cryobacterium luteum]SEO08065.1 Polyketide cyclase / dehydrase and lipid transport [Cryobacterium luteum]
MPNAIETVDVNVPVTVSYNQWTKFEEFPKFLSFVESVTQVSDTLTEWKVKIGGVEREFEARISEQHPDERVAWNSTGGQVDHAGVVTFHKLAEDETRVTVQLDWEAKGLLEKAGAALGIDNHAIKKDLANFKEFIEAKGTDDVGWRGDVQA